jgi:hypothetical protein
MLAGGAAIYGAHTRDWQWLVAGALLFGATLLPIAYDKIVLAVVLKDGPEVILDASRGEK